jgi:hypothetical protein
MRPPCRRPDPPRLLPRPPRPRRPSRRPRRPHRRSTPRRSGRGAALLRRSAGRTLPPRSARGIVTDATAREAEGRETADDRDRPTGSESDAHGQPRRVPRIRRSRSGGPRSHFQVTRTASGTSLRCRCSWGAQVDGRSNGLAALAALRAPGAARRVLAVAGRPRVMRKRIFPFRVRPTGVSTHRVSVPGMGVDSTAPPPSERARPAWYSRRGPSPLSSPRWPSSCVSPAGAPRQGPRRRRS